MKNAKREARHELLLTIGKHHFERYGFKRTVIDDIVKEAGVAKGTFYLHFKSKKELMMQVIEMIAEESDRRVKEIFNSQDMPKMKIKSLLMMMFDMLENEPILARMQDEGSDLVAVMKMMTASERVDERVKQNVNSIILTLNHGIEVGEFREDLDVEAFPFVMGSLKFLHRYKSMVTMGMIDEKRYINVLIDIVMKGLES